LGGVEGDVDEWKRRRTRIIEGVPGGGGLLEVRRIVAV